MPLGVSPKSNTIKVPSNMHRNRRKTVAETVFVDESLEHGTTSSPQVVHGSHNERRSEHRYQLDLAVRCKMLKNGGVITGRVHDMSRRSVCFVSPETPNTVEGEAKLFMDWPVCPADQTAMLLTAWRSIIRTGSQGIVVSIRRYEFRRRKTPS